MIIISIIATFSSQEKNQSSVVTSLEFLFNINVKQITEGVCFLSENHDKLLIGSCYDRQLFVFNSTGHYMSKVKVDGSRLVGAVWSLNDNIVYALENTENNIVVKSKSGAIVKPSITGLPSCLSISMDGIILLATEYHGIYQSDDNGLTWRLLFWPDTRARCLKVFKVPNGSEDNYWVLEELSFFKNRMRICSFGRKTSANGMHCADANLPLICFDKSDCPNKSFLLYIGDGNLLFSQYAKTSVFLLSSRPADRHVLQLLSSENINDPYSLAFSKKRRYLYVGQAHGKVGVFKVI